MESIESKVKELIKKFNTNNPIVIAKYLGINIRYMPLGNVYGFFCRHYRHSFIHINESLTESQQLFTCAHELGHALFHSDANTPFLSKKTYFSTDKLEMEANMFAIELLFSDSMFESVTLEEATRQYGIPISVIHKKIYAK